MRMMLIAGIAAAGIGLAAASGALAAPVNGSIIDELATATDNVAAIRWWGHWRWGGRGYYHRRWGYGYGYSYRGRYPFDRQICCRF
jgi:ABC-type glycerol-3-phosphate transport system substrate-binding protein